MANTGSSPAGERGAGMDVCVCGGVDWGGGGGSGWLAHQFQLTANWVLHGNQRQMLKNRLSCELLCERVWTRWIWFQVVMQDISE